MKTPVVITSGDPAGIGPDLILSLPEKLQQQVIVLADRQVLGDRARQLDSSIVLENWQPGQPPAVHGLSVWHCPANQKVTAGQPDPANSAHILTMLDHAIDGCLAGDFSAMVTAPLAKSVIREGIAPDFTGHTEYLAQRTDTPRVVMMLAGNDLKVALATTHLPLREVADALDTDTLESVIRILHQSLQQTFSLAQPRILVLGLNPHAGEQGHLGHEEQQIIIPLLEKLRQQGFSLTGPVPADTAFNPKSLAKHDAVLAMYHDQGLPVLKYAAFGEAINITLGLPLIRTSVDHGTAFDLAGSGKAEPGSLIAATEYALSLSAQHHSG